MTLPAPLAQRAIMPRSSPRDPIPSNEQQTSVSGYTRASGEQVSYFQKRSESGHGVARGDNSVMQPAQIRRPAHGPEAVHSPAVADRLAAVWAASQEDELAGRQGMVPAVALPAAWVSGLRSRCFVMRSCGERHRAASLPQEFNLSKPHRTLGA